MQKKIPKMTSKTLPVSYGQNGIAISAEDLMELRNTGYNLDQLVNGRTLFMMAVCKEDVPLCKVLLDLGADMNKEASTPPFDLKMKPICQAIRSENIVLTKMLIEAGASREGYDSMTNPLHLAVDKQKPEFVKLLLEAGCNVNNNSGIVQNISPLHRACAKGNLEIVEMLLQHGADPNAKESSERFTPGFQTTSIPILQILIAHGMNIDSRGRSGETMLHGAVSNGDHRLVVFLLNHGANVNVTQLKYRFATTNILHSCYEQTVIHIAAEENNFEICAALIQHGCNLNFLLDPENSSDILHRILNTADMALVRTLIYSAGNWDWTKLMSYNKLSHFYGKEKLDEVWNWLVHYSRNPFPLKAQCRLFIRRHYQTLHKNRSIYLPIHKLPIPDLLRRYLILEYID